MFMLLQNYFYLKYNYIFVINGDHKWVIAGLNFLRNAHEYVQIITKKIQIT